MVSKARNFICSAKSLCRSIFHQTGGASQLDRSNALITRKKSQRHYAYFKTSDHKDKFWWKKQRDKRNRSKNILLRRNLPVLLGVHFQHHMKLTTQIPITSCLMAHGESAYGDTAAFTWHIDSGASAHMTSTPDLFENLESVDPFDVLIENYSIFKSHGKGAITFQLLVEGISVKFRLSYFM